VKTVIGQKVIISSKLAMHKIQVAHTIQLELSQESTDLEKVKALLREAEENAAKIIAGACSVEKMLSEIIAHYFNPQVEEARTALKEMIIDSDWCSFGNKRKIIEKIITKNNLFSGDKFSHYQRLLSETMKYRNAFAHGQFCVSQHEISLSYYDGKTQVRPLTDEFLKQIEQTLSEANTITTHLALSVGLKNIFSYKSENVPPVA
jgi:uncharacterized protein YacL (UPF0231 family)